MGLASCPSSNGLDGAPMRPDDRFLGRDKAFWAHVRAVSETIGYTQRGSGLVKVPSEADIGSALNARGLDGTRALSNGISADLHSYFRYRAEALNDHVQHVLMNANEAEDLFEQQRRLLNPSCPLPMNKQKGEKKKPAFLTGLVNMQVEAHSRGLECDYDPRSLTTFTKDGAPLRTLARRVDGAFPSTVNPTALWEIKEYYYTTTFGSRVADGVYETLLDGMELEELRNNEGVKAHHYLMVDSHYTWWECGRSYLCRIIDMLNMGLVDEVLFGREVVSDLPRLVKEWVEISQSR